MNEELIEAARAIASELAQDNYVTRLERAALAQCAAYVNSRNADYIVSQLDANCYRAFVFATILNTREHVVCCVQDYETLALARSFVDAQYDIDTIDTVDAQARRDYERSQDVVAALV